MNFKTVLFNEKANCFIHLKHSNLKNTSKTFSIRRKFDLKNENHVLNYSVMIMDYHLIYEHSKTCYEFCDTNSIKLPNAMNKC